MSFIDFARGHGVEIDQSKFYASDKIKRCGTVERPRSLNGAYFWDGQRGWCQDWSGEARTIWYEDPNAKPWTDQEKNEWALKRKAAASDQDKKYDEVATRALSTLKQAKLSKHPYLEYKGLKEELGLVIGDTLYIPMRNVATNKIQGYQSIVWNPEGRKYDKKMLYGMRAKNAVLMLGDRSADEFWLCEGFSTGLSLRLALRSIGDKATVVVCFSASNMIQIASQVPRKRYIFADRDLSGVGEKSAIQANLPYVMADQEGWDANDLHKRSGLFSVVAKIMLLKSQNL